MGDSSFFLEDFHNETAGEEMPSLICWLLKRLVETRSAAQNDGEVEARITYSDWRRAVADQCESGPLDGKRLVGEFFEKVEFRLLEHGAFVGPFDKMLVYQLHEGDRERVVSGPKAGDHRFCAGEKKRATCGLVNEIQ
jgi:hypothetical protein